MICKCWYVLREKTGVAADFSYFCIEDSKDCCIIGNKGEAAFKVHLQLNDCQ